MHGSVVFFILIKNTNIRIQRKLFLYYENCEEENENCDNENGIGDEEMEKGERDGAESGGDKPGWLDNVASPLTRFVV